MFAPVALSVLQKPGHTDAGFATGVMVGKGFTVTITVLLLVQPPEFPITV